MRIPNPKFNVGRDPYVYIVSISIGLNDYNENAYNPICLVQYRINLIIGLEVHNLGHSQFYVEKIC